MSDHLRSGQEQSTASDQHEDQACARTDAPWGEVTFALVFPYHLDWRAHGLCEDPSAVQLRSGERADDSRQVPPHLLGETGVARRTWDPLRLNPGQLGDGAVMTVRDSAYQHWFDPGKYFHSPHLADRVVTTGAVGQRVPTGSLYEAWTPGSAEDVRQGRALPGRLYDIYGDFILDPAPEASQRLEVLAAERHEFAPSDPGEGGTPLDAGAGFAVVHLKAVGFTSDELTRLSEYSSKPSLWGKRAEEEKGLSADLTRILHGIGLHMTASRGGFTDHCRVQDGEFTCRADQMDVYIPHDTEVQLSGWREWKVRKHVFPDDVKESTLLYTTGQLGGPAGWRPGSARRPGRLPKAYNRILGLWCLPLDDRRRPAPYTLFHLESSETWSEEEKWSYQLAAGHRLNGTYALPDDTRAEAADGTAHALGCDLRVSPTGLAVLLDPALRTSRADFVKFKAAAADQGRRLADFTANSYVSEPVIRSVVHGRFVELAMLALRQRFFLADHVQALARVHEPGPASGDEGEAGSALAAIELEQRFQWFINQRWFDEVPGRREATEVLRTFQQQWGMTAELERIRQEQEGIFRIQTFAHRERQEAEQQQTLERRRAAEDARNSSREFFEFAASVFAPPALVFSALAVFQDPGEELFWRGIGWSLAFVFLLVGFVCFRWVRRRRDRVQERDGQPTRREQEEGRRRYE